MAIPSKIQEVMDKATCLHTRTDVEKALDKMAIEIHSELADKNPLVLAVMIGGLIPLGNLLPRLDFPLEVNYVHATRYRGKTSGSELHWKVRPDYSLKGRTVLIVDDILDQGLTLAAIVKHCEDQGAEEIYSAVLVDKNCDREEGGTMKADFTGLEVENKFVFGYGLDYEEYLRNAPGIYAVAAEHQ